MPGRSLSGDRMNQATLQLRRPQSGRLLSEDEAIGYLGLSARPNPKGALRWLMRTRRLAYVRLAKGIYGFTEADLDAFIAQKRVPAAGEKKSSRNRV